MIYFIQGKTGTPIKVGYTADENRLKTRMASIQTGYPYELTLLLLIEDGDKALELRLHKLLRADRLRGEWFEARPRTESLIQYLRPPGDFEEGIVEFLAACAVYDSVIGSETALLAESKIAPLFRLQSDFVDRQRAAGSQPRRKIEVMHGAQLCRWFPLVDIVDWLRALGVTTMPAAHQLRWSTTEASRLAGRRIVSGELFAP